MLDEKVNNGSGDRVDPVFFEASSRVGPPPYTEVNIHEESQQKAIMNHKRLEDFEHELVTQLDQ